VVETELSHRAGLEVFAEDVGGRDEPQHDLPAARSQSTARLRLLRLNIGKDARPSSCACCTTTGSTLITSAPRSAGSIRRSHHHVRELTTRIPAT
jgi:hypothetical protein